MPVEEDNIWGLNIIEDHILFAKSGAPFYGRDSYVKPSLQICSMKDREVSTLVENIEGYALS